MPYAYGILRQQGNKYSLIASFAQTYAKVLLHTQFKWLNNMQIYFRLNQCPDKFLK